MKKYSESLLMAGSILILSCTARAADTDSGEAIRPSRRGDKVRPGITVLLRDSLELIAGRRVGLLTNQSGVDEQGTSTIDLMHRAASSEASAGGTSAPALARPRLVALFSPEHGIRGTEDRTNLASGRDERTGLPIHSTYGATVLPPPDSTMRDLDALVVDLQDLGARPWTYVATMVYAMRSAAQHKVRFIVLDRPNPITGARTEGPMLDSSLAYAGSHTAARAAQPVSLHPIPLRHGLTMGELARFYNDALSLGADLHVVPTLGWRRDMWFDETGLPWVKPSPNMPNLTSATIYPGVVAFEATNLSVGRGTPDAFQRVGAPWLNARKVAEMLEDLGMPGVGFEAEEFTPVHPTDQKYAGVKLPGVRIRIVNRDRLQSARVGAAILWAVAKLHRDSLRVNSARFDALFGSPRAREALLRGDDPDSVIDQSFPAIVEFQQRTRKYLLY
ncbi:MAG: exo-beta-N-acetylmuramidase NamZ domain-containing protein [Gemmatimonadaceae bacterium]